MPPASAACSTCSAARRRRSPNSTKQKSAAVTKLKGGWIVGWAILWTWLPKGAARPLFKKGLPRRSRTCIPIPSRTPPRFCSPACMV